MRRAALPIALLIGIYLDSILFCRLNISGIRPDALLAVAVSAGVLLGSVKGGLLGVGIGLFMDVLFGKCVGLSAIAYMVAGAAGGMKLRVAMAGEDAGNSPSLEEAARKAFGDMLEIVE